MSSSTQGAPAPSKFSAGVATRSLGRKELLSGLRNKELFTLLASTFQALGDSSRVQIVWALSKGEFSVGDIAVLLEMSQPAVSHHLRMLRNLRLVKVRRSGRTSFYSLDDDHITRLLHEGIEHVEDLL
ncbi:MAG: helix-turn-helix domain-containing protein [Bdellovibrionales bacterium]|nr:helix-turn-helix domain-containing protein [Bdellovibrionales bacterium]